MRARRGTRGRGRAARAVVVAAVLGGLAVAAPAAADLSLKGVAGFDRPTYLTAPPGDPDRLFVTERAGTIRVVVRGKKRRQPFLAIKGLVSTRSEGGLLSMAFAPDYERSGKFYVYYVDNRQRIRVDQFRARPGSKDRARRKSRQNIITIASPPDTHKGGQLQMTRSGYLLLATGDGGNYMSPSRKPQSRTSLRGKLLRLKPAANQPARKRQYRVHPENPFVGRQGNGAIMALGLRNPWRFSLDRERPARIAIADVGHGRVEEVNFGSLGRFAGANFGWPCWEGRKRMLDCRVPRHRKPSFTYGHSGGRCSITGGYLNRAPGLPRQGHFFYGDYCSGEIRTVRLRPKRSGRSRATSLRVPALVSFGEDSRGRLYTVSLNGLVSRIVKR